MQKDLKIGMGVGLLLVLMAALWLATRPSLSAKARLLNTSDSNQRQNPVERPVSQPLAQSDDIPSAGPPGGGPDQPQFHTVSAGETLSAISYKYYGTANKWQKILEANRDVIKSPDKLINGTKLVIPQDEKEGR